MSSCENHTDTCVKVAEAKASSASAHHRIDKHDTDIDKNRSDISEVKGDLKEIKKTIGIYSAIGAGGINIVIEFVKATYPTAKAGAKIALSIIFPDSYAGQ